MKTHHFAYAGSSGTGFQPVGLSGMGILPMSGPEGERGKIKNKEERTSDAAVPLSSFFFPLYLYLSSQPRGLEARATSTR
jgi:hypothetical protein